MQCGAVCLLGRHVAGSQDMRNYTRQASHWQASDTNVNLPPCCAGCHFVCWSMLQFAAALASNGGS